MNNIRYEFICISPDGTANQWGYRTSENAAKKRYAELQSWIKANGFWADYKFEVLKAVSSTTYHPVDWI